MGTDDEVIDAWDEAEGPEAEAEAEPAEVNYGHPADQEAEDHRRQLL